MGRIQQGRIVSSRISLRIHPEQLSDGPGQLGLDALHAGVMADSAYNHDCNMPLHPAAGLASPEFLRVATPQRPNLVDQTGIEPASYSLKGCCSNR